MSQQQHNTVPLHPDEFQMLHTALGSYLEFLHRAAQPSEERAELITVLQAVHVRLAQMLRAQQEGAELYLTTIEVQALDTAVQTFCRLVPLVVEPSQQRDDTLQALEMVRLRVRSLVFARND